MPQQNSQPIKFTIRTMQQDIQRVSAQERPLSSITPDELFARQNAPSSKTPSVKQNIPQKLSPANHVNEANNLLKEGQALYRSGNHLDALEKFEQAIKLPISWWLKYKINKAIKNCAKTISLLEKERNEKQKKLETQLKKQIDEKIEQEKIPAITPTMNIKQEEEQRKIEKQELRQELEEKNRIETEQRTEIEKLKIEIQRAKEAMTQKSQQIEMEAEARAIEVIAHKEAEQQAKIKELEQKIQQEKETQATLERRIKQQMEIEQKNQAEMSVVKSLKEAKEINEIKSKIIEPPTIAPAMPIPSPIAPIKPAAPPKQTAILPTPPITPSPAAIIKKEKIFKFTKLFSTRTIIVVFVILSLLSGGIYWFNAQKISTDNIQPQSPALIEPLQPAALPSPIFKVESSETILLSDNSDRNNFIDKLKGIDNHEQEMGEFKQIILEKESTNAKQYFSLMTLFQILEIELFIPRCRDNLDININQKCIDEQIDAANYMLFIYGQREISQNPFEAGKGRNRLGIVIKSNEATLKSLEKNIQEISSVLLLREKPTADNDLVFQENAYRDIAIRYINLPNKYSSIDYAIVNNHLVITTSQESMYTAIDRLLAKK